MFVVISLLITIWIQICSSALSFGAYVCMVADGQYGNQYGGSYGPGGCETNGVMVVNGVRVDQEPKETCTYSDGRYYLRESVAGYNDERREIILSENPIDDTQDATDWEIYCNTDAAEVLNQGFRRSVANNIDPTLTCGGWLRNAASLKTVEIESGSCPGLF